MIEVGARDDSVMDVQRQAFEAPHGGQTVTPRLARAPRGRVGRGHALILLVPAALLVLATACAQTSSLDDPFALMADSVIGAGFTHISERFLEPVSMPDIATDSMSAVSQFDGTLKVVRQKDRVELDQDGQLLHAYSLPKGEDPEAWADVTTALFEDARLASTKLHDTDPELI
jgi:hypothetical protein